MMIGQTPSYPDLAGCSARGGLNRKEPFLAGIALRLTQAHFIKLTTACWTSVSGIFSELTALFLKGVQGLHSYKEK